MNAELKKLTEKSVADMIMEQYKKKYVKGMTEKRAFALLLLDARKYKPELRLAIAFAAERISKEKPRGWRKIRGKLKYKRIVKLPSVVKVLMLPSWERFELLRSHPTFQKLLREIK